MIKIKVFRFEVSNWASIYRNDSSFSDKHIEGLKRLWSTEQIENTINDFCEQHEILNVLVNTVDVFYNNHREGNLIDLVYTITYKE